MKVVAALLLALAATSEGQAATAYVSDELILGVYAGRSTEGARLATLHSGATVDTLASSGDATQVRLADGTTGWVKTAYLTSSAPATVRIKQLQEELDRRLATTPGLAEAAERSEVERLKRELAQAGRIAPQAAPVPWRWCVVVCIALALGFWLGYATLARRVKFKFGGIKVY